ncbi:MAG TPA: ABC transporter permease [Pyrinomonadaceae bacterium]|nr:ABC transporter permease [Pyrinomonadaceae bacterium]
MGILWQDLRYGFRMLAKNPGFTAVAVLAIALGIGANTTIFSTVNALLLRPFSFDNQDRLMMIWERVPEMGVRRGSVAPGNFADWRDQSQSFEEIAAVHKRAFNLTEGDQPERVSGSRVSPRLFAALNVKALRGRVFTDEEGQTGHEQVALVKESLWERRYASDPNLVGRQIMVDGRSFTVVGILPKDFNFPVNGGELWTPLAFDAKEQGERAGHYLEVVARLKPGVSREQAQAELDSISRRSQQQFPDTNTGRSAFVEGLNESYTRGSRMYLNVLMAAVVFVLLIACANVANLLLVRSTSRQKEIAVRMALGGSRWRLIRQLLTESIALALIGGALGLLFSVWGIEFIKGGIPPGFTQYIPGWEKMRLDAPVLLFTLVVTILTGAVFGLAPALQATRLNLNESLKESGKGASSGASRNRLRSLLVISELALSLVLLVGAGLMIRSFVQLMRSDLGVNASNVLTMELSIPRLKYPEEQQRVNFYQELVSRVRGLPGVTQAAAVNFAPMARSSSSVNFRVDGQPPPVKGKEPLADYRVITPGYFEAMGTTLRQGRVFTEQDKKGSTPVVIISEQLARRYFPTGDALGKRLVISEEEGPLEIVGVAADIKDDDLNEESEMTAYRPFMQEPWWSMTLVARTNSEPTEFTQAIRNEVRAIDPEQPVYNVKTMEQIVDESISAKRLAMVMLGFFAFGALLLAAIGIYAVMSYSVTSRSHEIGIRMALGAQPTDILRLIIRQGLVLTLIGIVLGLAGAFALTRAMTEILYGVDATDPLTFGGISLLLSLVALAACYIPARRATRVDPMVALRYE